MRQTMPRPAGVQILLTALFVACLSFIAFAASFAEVPASEQAAVASIE